MNDKREWKVEVPLMLVLQDPDVANRWRALRCAHNLSQDEVAARIGVNRNVINRIECGRIDRSRHLAALAELYGVELELVLRPFLMIDRAEPPESDKLSMGQAIRRRRERMGWTRVEFAAEVGMTYNRLYRLEQRDQLVEEAEIFPIAVALGVDANDLLERGRRADPFDR